MAHELVHGRSQELLDRMSRIDSWHRQISTSRHFQNGHHNVAQIQHCPISTTFHMWVDYDVPNWFLTSKISTGRHFQNGHHNTAQIQQCSISMTFHMWVDYDIPTLKNFYRSPFSKWQPQYRTNSTLSDFNDISYVGRLWCPEMIPDIEKISTGRHFQNGHHNTAQIQHCPISTTFHICVDLWK